MSRNASAFFMGKLGARLAAVHGESCATRKEKRRWAQQARRMVKRLARDRGVPPDAFKTGRRFCVSTNELLSGLGPLGMEMMARQMAEAA